ncbi:hypothetical protein DVH26_02815 [Paenibacillus sp. H1-7]|nr:hypothetical protein DVH26_02815 [Paenibacillus sp. H1-7]
MKQEEERLAPPRFEPCKTPGDGTLVFPRFLSVGCVYKNKKNKFLNPIYGRKTVEMRRKI